MLMHRQVSQTHALTSFSADAHLVAYAHAAKELVKLLALQS